MSKTHSPGPWRVGKKQERAILDANGSQIAVLPDSLKADACLIAAAPEMLEMLKRLAFWLELSQRVTPFSPDDLFLLEVDELIAKAEGNVKTEAE